MKAIVADYFAYLFATGSPFEFDAAMEGLECRVTEEINMVLEKEKEPPGRKLNKHCSKCIRINQRDLTECSSVVDIIRIYERASGQKVNLEKAEVTFSKCVPFHRRAEMIETLGVHKVDRHEKYLGSTDCDWKVKEAVFACLKKRIWKKLNGWKEKLLLRPVKEVLIKAVAQAIPTYMMSIFKIMEGLIDEIYSLLCRFWWGSMEDVRKLH
ncbi:uncharacterized protein LOC110703014 [Chenopodium quinoa]|uniref:uncharacterized protein LOC110703014 n=1 Tax=Chenopodium quinoa TaxID=63459 RepID=UPI000B76BFB5|nr:uncharacterized protein LOC110703014 [Chenopodium quinoa]